MEDTSVVLLNSEISEVHIYDFLKNATASFAYRQLNFFGRLGVDSRFAPHVLLQDAVAEVAHSEYLAYRRYANHLTRLCNNKNVFVLVQQFEEATKIFHERTEPVDWIGSIVKAYIVGSMNEDYRTGFTRLLYNSTVHYTVSPEIASMLQSTILVLSGEATRNQPIVSAHAPLRDIIVQAVARDDALRYRLAMWMNYLAKEFLSLLNNPCDNTDANRIEAILLKQLFLLYPEGEASAAKYVQEFCNELAWRHSLRTEALHLEH